MAHTSLRMGSSQFAGVNASPNLSHCLFSWASVTIYLTADSKVAPTNYINVVVSNRNTHFFSLKVLEAGSSKISFSGLKSAIGRTSLPPDALGRICYLPLPASGGLLAYLHITIFKCLSHCQFSHCPLFCCVYIKFCSASHKGINDSIQVIQDNLFIHMSLTNYSWKDPLSK